MISLEGRFSTSRSMYPKIIPSEEDAANQRTLRGHTATESRYSIMNTLSPLGILSKLPPELRCKIWSCLWPRDMYTEKNGLSILRTSKQINREVIGEAYRHRTMKISIRAADDRWIVGGRLRAPWDGMKDLLVANYVNYEDVDVKIHLPDVKDPGQMLRLRAHMMSLVAFLEGFTAKKARVMGRHLYRNSVQQYNVPLHQEWLTFNERRKPVRPLPKITVRIVDPKKSPQASCPKSRYTDLECVLGPLLLLRESRRVSVVMTSAGEGPSDPSTFQGFVEDQRAKTRKRIVNSERWMENKHLLGKSEEEQEKRIGEAIKSAYLEAALDDIQGETAKRFRHSRSRRWFCNLGSMISLLDLLIDILENEEGAKHKKAFETRRGSIERSSMQIGYAESSAESVIVGSASIQFLENRLSDCHWGYLILILGVCEIFYYLYSTGES